MDMISKAKPRAVTNETWYTYKNNKLVYSINQEIDKKMTIIGKCYYNYDKKGNLILIKEILTDTKNEYKPSIFYKKYKYDHRNRLVYFDNNGEVIKYKYNRKNNIICKEWEIEFGAFAKSLHKYKDGREVLIKCSEGWTEKKIYKKNRILSIRKNKKNEIINKEMRKLDKRGNVIEIRDKNRTFQYKYDELNNIIFIKEFDNKYIYRQTWHTYEKNKLVYTKEQEYMYVPVEDTWFYGTF